MTLEFSTDPGPAPDTAFRAGRFQFGRYRRPIPWPDSGLGAARFRLKEWSYGSVATPEWFVAHAVVQLGYVAQAFAHVVDRRTGVVARFEALSPLGRALSFAESSVQGTSVWRSGGALLESRFDHGYVTRFDLPMGGERLRGELRAQPDDALALLFPLGPERPAYTHKEAGMRADGNLRLGSREISLSDGLGTLDWTRSQADRHTRWNWASFVGRTRSGKRFGLNLSAHVYDRAGSSMENGVWLDGRLSCLGGVAFDVPRRSTDPWHIRSLDGSGQVLLEVLPEGQRRSAMNLGLVRSRFVQPFGQARGEVLGEVVDSVFGVVEDHDALW